MAKVKEYMMELEELIYEAYVDHEIADYDGIVEYVQTYQYYNDIPVSSVNDICYLIDSTIAYGETYQV